MLCTCSDRLPRYVVQIEQSLHIIGNRARRRGRHNGSRRGRYRHRLCRQDPHQRQERETTRHQWWNMLSKSSTSHRHFDAPKWGGLLIIMLLQEPNPPLPHLLPSSIIQGAVPTLLHKTPDSSIRLEQQSLPPRPKSRPRDAQPRPPQVPHSSTQHTPDSSTPVTPLLHVSAVTRSTWSNAKAPIM